MNEDNDIAIIGIGCMFPGADNLEEFWKVLVNGEDHVQDIPPERFNVEAFYDPDPDCPEKTYLRKAGLLKKFDEWDNRFFGINDKEAETIDPQQHFVLETVHMALEDAGITKEKIAGSKTGVYIGAMSIDWDCIQRSRQKTTNTMVTACDSSLLSAKVNYFYNLLGPAITINTACSSAMVAFHTASQALKNGEISMAIAGAVNVILDPAVFVTLSSARMASLTGKCHTFSQNADGYARGEGCGIVIMKRLSDALHDRNKIWGTLFTGLNQDGHMSTPITSPSGEQQEQLLKEVFEKCKILPNCVQYIEAHGTGTTVGDFTEVSALGTFFSKHAMREILIGSVKTNIGHLEPCAGAASLIKVLLMMKNKTFVPSIHAEPLNSRIKFTEYKLKVCQKVSIWHSNEKGNRIASINCFGFGGTNAHAVVSDYQANQVTVCKELQTCLSFKKYVVLTANDLKALQSTARALLTSLQNETSINDLSSTSVHSRSHFNFRKVFVVNEANELVTELRRFIAEEMTVKMVAKEKPRIVFVYCGVGTAWTSMCKYFITHDDVFSKCIKKIDSHLSSLTDISIYSIFENEENLSDPLKNHLAIFACQIGLTDMWRHLGVYPDCIVGQSVGEIAAAYASETLTLKDAVKVIYLRSQNLAKESSGKMIVVQNCDVKAIEEKCRKLRNGQANIAVFHSPVSCAVSGDETAIEEIITKLADEPVKIISLNVKCAYHSHLTKKPSVELKEALKGLTFKNPRIPLISTVTGKLADQMFGSASYWAANVSEPVLFENAIKEAKRRNTNIIFLEIGPNPVLKAHLPNIFPDSVENALPSMKTKTEIEIFQKSFLQLFCNGISVAWSNVVPFRTNVLPVLRYQFSKEKHLSISEKMKNYLNGDQETHNAMLVSQVPGNAEQFSIVISKENTPFVYEHSVQGNIIIPAALYGEVAMEIGNILLKNNDLCVSWSIHNVTLVNDGEQSIVIKTKMESEDMIFNVFSSENALPVSSGRVTKDHNLRQTNIDPLRLLSILNSSGKPNLSYLILRDLGIEHGPMYQTIKRIALRNKEIVSEVFLPDSVMKDAHKMYLHPVIIDTMFQSCSGAGLADNLSKQQVLPARISHLVVRQRPTQRMICYTTIVFDNTMKSSFDIILINENGGVIAEIRGFEAEKIRSPDSIRSLSYYQTWKQIQLKRNMDLNNKKNVFIISWRKQYISSIKNAFCTRQSGVKIFPVLLTDSTISMSLQEQDYSQNTSVIFAPGLNGIDESTTGEQLLKSVCKITSNFLELLKLLYHSNIHIVVVTNETQSCGACNVQVLGAELWGMVRAVIHEGTTLSFTLLDIDILNEFALHNIVHICLNLEFESRHVPREYAIREHVLFASELAKLPADFHMRSYKSSFEETSQPVCIRLEDNGNKEKFFGIPSKHNNSSLQNLICVKPTQTVVCSEDTFFTLRKNDILDQLDMSINGKEIRVCEVIGRATLRKSEIEVVACCHTELTTEMKIERNCVFPKSSFEGYEVGHMHATIVAHAIADLIPKKTNVIVQCSQNNYIIYYFICILLKKKKCLITYQDDSSGKWSQNTTVTELIVLAKSGYVEKTTFRLHYPSLQRCITLKGILPSPMLNENNMFIVIDVEKLYQQTNIYKISQRAFRFLKKSGRHRVQSKSKVIDIKGITRHLEIRTTNDFLIRGDSAYIVVGGLTGLGWLIVKYLARRKAHLIITLSRRSLTKETKQRILNIKHIHGVDVVHKSVDITKLDDLTRVIKNIQTEKARIPIRGVFQGAGILRDSTLLKMTQEDFELPLAAKIIGTWNLHLVTKEMDLDIFLMHSSVASIFGNYSQTNYAAANAFQDSFAHYRKAMNLPVQTINWGALDVGMASDTSIRDIFFFKGVKLMSEGQIQNCLTQMLLSDITQAIFADFDVEQLFTEQKLMWEDSKYSSVIPVDQMKAAQETLIGLSGNAETTENMIDLVKQITSQVIMVDVSDLNDTKTLVEFGVDSQNGIEIINTIFSITKVRIPIVRLMAGGFTVSDLGKFIQEKIELNAIAEKTNEDGEQISTTSNFQFIKQENSILVFSFEIAANINNPKLWEKILQIMIRINKAVRTVKSKVDSREKSVNSNRTIDIEEFMLPFECVHEENLSSKMKESKDSIISAAYIDMKSSGILHLFCRRSHFDVFCGDIILRDLQTISEYVISGQIVPEWLDRANLDIIAIGNGKLHSVSNKCHTYWKTRLLLCKTSASLKSIDTIREENINQSATKINLPDVDMKIIQDIASENGWTTCGMVASVFQIILHQVTNITRIPLMMEVDMRTQIQECSDQMAACSNFIPIISPDISYTGATIQQFIEEVNKMMKDDISYSIFPYAFIEELPEFDSQLHNIHSFVFETKNVDHEYINLKSTSIERHAGFETLLYASHNIRENTLTVEFHFCQQRVSSNLAFIICEYLWSFFQTLPKTINKPLCHLQTVTSLLEGGPVLLPPGPFFWLQENDCLHPVLLSIQHGSSPTLTWRTNSTHQTHLSGIKHVDLIKIKGHYDLRLQYTDERKSETFRTADFNICRNWLAFLRSYLPSNMFEKSTQYHQTEACLVENTHL